MLIEGETGGPQTFIGVEALHCIKMLGLNHEKIPLGDILVDPFENRAYGINGEPIVDKDMFGKVVLAMWQSKCVQYNSHKIYSLNN